MRHGTHEDPVRPKGSRRKTQSIPRVKRQPIALKHAGDERSIWLRGR